MPDLPNRVKAQHPIDLYRMLDTLFRDEEWLDWEPETLIRQADKLEDPIAQDKLLAIQSAAANSRLVLSNAVAFEKVVLAFSNNHIIPDAPQSPYLEEVFYAVDQLRELIQLVHDQKAEFIGEVPGYVSAVARHRGWQILPAGLNFAQQSLNFLWGLREGASRHMEFQGVLQRAETLAASLEKVRFDSEQLKDLDGLGADADPLLLRYVGLFVFDPTVPFR